MHQYTLNSLEAYIDYYYFRSFFKSNEVQFEYTDKELIGFVTEQYEDKKCDNLEVEIGLAKEDDKDRKKQELVDMEKDIEIQSLKTEYRELLVRHKQMIKQSDMILKHSKNSDAEQFCRDAQEELERLEMVFPSKITRKLLQQLIIINKGEQNEHEHDDDNEGAV